MQDIRAALSSNLSSDNHHPHSSAKSTRLRLKSSLEQRTPGSDLTWQREQNGVFTDQYSVRLDEPTFSTELIDCCPSASGRNLPMLCEIVFQRHSDSKIRLEIALLRKIHVC